MTAEHNARDLGPCPGPGPVLRCYLPPGHEGPCLTWEDALRRTYERPFLDPPEPPRLTAAEMLRLMRGGDEDWR